MPTKDDYEWIRIASATTIVVVGAACKLINVCVNTFGGTISVYNAATSATALSSNLVGVISSSTIPGVYLRGGKKLGTGLVVVTGATAGDITVTYATA